MAKRRGKRRERSPKPTVDYTDPDGNVLTLRESLSRGTIRKITSEHRLEKLRNFAAIDFEH